MSQGTDETTETSPSSDQLEMTKRLRLLRLQAAGGGIDDVTTTEPSEHEVDHDHFRRIREQSDHSLATQVPVLEPSEPELDLADGEVTDADISEADISGDDSSEDDPSDDHLSGRTNAEDDVETPTPEPIDSDDGPIDPGVDADIEPEAADQDPDSDLETATEAEAEAEAAADTDTDTDGTTEADTEPVEDPDLLGAAATLPVLRAGGRARRAQKAAGKQIEATETTETSVIRANADAAQGEIVQVFDAHHAASVNLRDYIKDLWIRRKFLAALAKSDIKGRRSSTYFGAVWGLLDPMFQSAIYFFVFIIIRGGQGGRPVEFLPLLIGGVFLFRLFTSALSEGGKSVRRSTSLMLNANFPRALLPLSTVYKGLLEFAPTVFIYVLIYAFLGPSLQKGLLILPVLFLIQTILGAGVALLASTLVVFFQDVENLLRYVQRMLFFTTPIIFPVDKIPEGMIPYLRFNPLFGLFYSYQTALGGGVAPTEYVVQAAIWAVVLLATGAWVFLRFERAMASKL